MDTQKWNELKQLVASALGAESIKQVLGQISPEELFARAEVSLQSQLKEVLTEVFNDPNNPSIKELSDRLYEDLDVDKVIEALTPSLATDLSAYFKEEGSEVLLEVLVKSIIDDYLDFDWLAEQVAEKVAKRLQVTKEES